MSAGCGSPAQDTCPGIRACDQASTWFLVIRTASEFSGWFLGAAGILDLGAVRRKETRSRVQAQVHDLTIAFVLPVGLCLPWPK